MRARRREPSESQELRRRDYLVGDEHVADTRLDERGGLVDLLAADAHRAARDLQLRDLGRLVRLPVRPQAQAPRRDVSREHVHVALERVEVDAERGGLDGLDRVAGPGGRALHVGSVVAASVGGAIPVARGAGIGAVRRIMDAPRRDAGCGRVPAGTVPCAAGRPAIISTMRVVSRHGR